MNRKKTIIFLYLLFSLVTFVAHGESSTTLIEKSELSSPDPRNLSPDWWNYFQTDEKELAKRVEIFQENLQVLLKQISPEKQEIAQSLIEKINTNLHLFYQLHNQVTVNREAPVEQKTFQVAELLSLFRQIRVKTSSLKADIEERNDKERQIKAAKDHLSTLAQIYFEKKEPSEEKTLAGLEWIAFQTFYKIREEQFNQLKKKIEGEEASIKQMQEVLKTASISLTVDLSLMIEAEQERAQAEKNWEVAKMRLEDKEASSVIILASLPQTDKAKLEAGLVNQGLMLATVQENIAQVHLISMQIQYEIVNYLLNKGKGLFSYSEAIKKWEKELNQLNEELVGSERLLQREIQRIEEALSISEKSLVGIETIETLERKIRKQAQDTLLLLQRLSYEIDESHFLTETFQNLLYSEKSPIVRGFYTFFGLITESFKSISTWLNQVLFYIGTSPVTFLSILRFFIIILAAIWISRLVLVALTEVAIRRKGIKKSLLYRLNRLVNYSILALGLAIALSSIGFDFSNFVLIAGALGVGLGFGLQSIFNNFISGIILLFENQLKVGDSIELESGVSGEVKEINFRSTYIRTSDGIAIIVPNSEFINKRVINRTLKDPYRRLHVPFILSYDADLDYVIQIVEEAANLVPVTLTQGKAPEPKVAIEKFTENGIELELTVWLDESASKRTGQSKSLYLHAIYETLKKHAIPIPTPRREVYLHRE